MNELRLTVDDSVATIAIDRPDKRNALTQQMWDELATLVIRAGQDPSARVLQVRSAAPGVFSAGADIGEYRRFAGDVEWGLASQRRVGRALAAIRESPLPSIAVIDGACVGGGSGIALACDFRLVSSAAFFAITPARLGMVFPHEEIAHLIDLTGVAAAKRILLTGTRFDAQWALRTGFVDEVHAPADLDSAVQRLVGELTAVAPGSVRSMKRMIALAAAGVREPTEEIHRLTAEALAGPDHQEGVTAFLEGRTPVFTRSPG
jgi:enoyl-CoA hydratase/carnithine racemase